MRVAREPPAFVVLLQALVAGVRDGVRGLRRDPDRRRAALLSVTAHALLVWLIVWWLRLPTPEPTPTYLVIDIGVPALAEETVQAPTVDAPAATTPRPQVEDVEIGVPQAATTPLPQATAPDPTPQTAQPPAPDPTPAAPEPVVEAAPSPPVPTPALPVTAPEIPIQPVATTPLPAIVTPDLTPSPLAQRVEVPLPSIAAVVPEARAIAPTPSVTVAAPIEVPVPALRTDIAEPTSVPMPTVATEVAAARPVTVPTVRTDVAPSRAVGVTPQVSVRAPVSVPRPQLRADVLAPEAVPDAATVADDEAVAAAASAGSRSVDAPAGGDAARAGQAGPPSDPIETAGLGRAAGPDGSDTPTGSPAPPSVPFRQTLARPMAVVVDNDLSARAYPQSGFVAASQVHEMPVEGGLSRLVMVFDRDDPARVGPVRSARDYMVDLSRSMDAVMVHVGGSPNALNLIASTNTPTLDAFTSGHLFAGSAPGVGPFFSDGDALRAAVNRLDIGRGRVVSGVVYRPEPERDEADRVSVRFGGTYQTGFRYEEGLNAYRWLRNDTPAVDTDGESVLVDAVLIARVEARAIPGDAAGRLYVSMAGGDATLFVRGRVVEGRWSLAAGRGVAFTTSEGAVDLEPFKVWVVYAPSYAVVSVEGRASGVDVD